MSVKTTVERNSEQSYTYKVVLSSFDVGRLVVAFPPPGVPISEILLKVIALGIAALEKECVRSGDK